MHWWEILIVAVIALFAVGMIILSAVRKKQGKSSCCSECSCCPYHKDCKDAEKNPD